MSRFNRQLGQRRYRRIFTVIAEGTVTEQEYFSIFDLDPIVKVRCLPNQNNLPPNKALERALSVARQGIRAKDEIWVVVDRDSWKEDHLAAIHEWSQKKPNYGFALSNPRFESWLLLHFEDAKGNKLSKDCDSRLKKYQPNYNKHIDVSLFTPERIKHAIARAKKHDSPKCVDWPRKSGSTVYRLVEKLLGA